MCRFVVNGMGTPGVMPPFATIGLGTPALANAYGSGIPSLGGKKIFLHPEELDFILLFFQHLL